MQLTKEAVVEKLQKEFDDVFRYPYNVSTWGGTSKPPAVVVLLSAPHNGDLPEDDPAREMTKENVARALFSALLWNRAQAEQPEKVIYLVLSGETEQLPSMRELVVSYGVPNSHAVGVDCGKRGVGTTQTQFETLSRFFQGFAPDRSCRAVFVTSQPHTPRVRRYPEICEKPYTWQVAGVPFDVAFYDKKKYVDGEIDRIIRYARVRHLRLFPGQEVTCTEE